MSKKTIIKGTLILTVTGLITKILGFYNRIFLTRLIGVIELGKYQLIFPLYMFVFACCSQGISTTLTKQVSYYHGKKEIKKADYIFRLSVIIAVSLSTLSAILIYINSNLISYKLLKNTDCAKLLQVICIAIPFVALKSCINFYFIGIGKPGAHGFSHLFEQIIRISAAYVLSLIVISQNVNSTLAVIAVVIGEISAALAAVFIYFNYKSMNKRNSLSNINTETDSINIKNIKISRLTAISKNDKTKVIKYFAKDAVPITINNICFTLFSTLEAVIMPAMLFKFYQNSDKALEMFGIITGIVIPFILFPATISTSLSTMLLPAVSYANAKNDKSKINKALKECIFFCMLLGLIASFCFYIFGETICSFAFKSKEAGKLLKKLCLLCPLIYTSGNLTSILNGIDKALFALTANIIAITIRIAFNLFLVPRYGLNAYALGMFVSYMTLNLIMLTGISFGSTQKQKS